MRPLTVWLILITLTLATTFLGDNVMPGKAIIPLICLSVAWKGTLIADHFMGLKEVAPLWRWPVLAYATGMPFLIALSLVWMD